MRDLGPLLGEDPDSVTGLAQDLNAPRNHEALQRAQCKRALFYQEKPRIGIEFHTLQRSGRIEASFAQNLNTARNHEALDRAALK